ncbi:hypothetical protein PVPAM_110005000 [Plasmodium vivax]|nr:hypothetical protein PVPAM_110005000 [Plasmodium vivax]
MSEDVIEYEKLIDKVCFNCLPKLLLLPFARTVLFHPR